MVKSQASILCYLLFLDENRTSKITGSCVDRAGYAESFVCDYLDYRDWITKRFWHMAK